MLKPWLHPTSSSYLPHSMIWLLWLIWSYKYTWSDIWPSCFDFWSDDIWPSCFGLIDSLDLWSEDIWPSCFDSRIINPPSFLWFHRWFVPFLMTSMQSTLFYSGELRSYLSPHVGPDSALRMTLVPVGWRFSCNREMSLSSRAHKPPDFVQNAILAGVTHLEGKHRAGQG